MQELHAVFLKILYNSVNQFPYQLMSVNDTL